jgi:catechol 2,3-dioxygenase-like lactoylglutathione lyase family enzyme
MKPRINLITLGVDNLSRAVAFYQEGLGLPRFAFDSDQVAFFALNGSWLALYPRAALAADLGVPAAAGGFSAITLAHNVASRAEVDGVYAEAVKAGARVIKAPQETFWGGYSGYFADPDGHYWEVSHVPQFWIGPRDA